MEKKLGFALILIVLISLNSVLAINLDISTKPIQDSIILELNKPATFELTIRNLGEDDNFEIYSLTGINLMPENFSLKLGETKKINIQATLQNPANSNKGRLTFEYKIKNSKNEIQKEKLTINIIELRDAFSITPNYITPKSKDIKIIVKNKLNYEFEEIKIKMSSIFFNFEKTFQLNPFESKEFIIPLNEKTKSTVAGSYLLNTVFEVQNSQAKIESIIKFLKQEGIESVETKEGFLIKRIEIGKTNVGNVVKEVEINVEKNIFSYLFTTFNIVPTSINRKGLKIYYTWKKELIPNEQLKIIIKTNWLYPLLVILLAVGLFSLIKKNVEKDLILRKKVSFVKTKGGEFALKITIKAKAKKFIERINIIDKLPPLVELYDRYGAIAPDKVDLENRRLEWNIESLNEKEERIFSYIIYSKIGVIGKFELPKAKAIYEKEAKIKETESNRSFFINEPKDK